MSMTTTTNPIIWKTEAEAVKHARCYVAPSEDAGYAVADRVGARAFAEQCCIWHASYLVSKDRYESGELPTAICDYCGGRADVRIGFHHLCAARAKLGKPTPKLDVVDAIQCDCAVCRPGTRFF